MKHIKTTVNLVISRYSSSRGKQGIRVQIMDEPSWVCLAELDMTCEQFGEAVTGMSQQDIPCQTFVQDNRVGKERVNTAGVIDCPLPSHTKKEELRAWLHKNVKLKEGEVLRDNFGTQGGVVSIPDKGCRLRYTVLSWSEQPEQEEE